jgi:hypothetical protein
MSYVVPWYFTVVLLVRGLRLAGAVARSAGMV